MYGKSLVGVAKLSRVQGEEPCSLSGILVTDFCWSNSVKTSGL